MRLGKAEYGNLSDVLARFICFRITFDGDFTRVKDYKSLIVSKSDGIELV